MTTHTTTSDTDRPMFMSVRLLAFALVATCFVLLLGSGNARAVNIRHEITNFGPDGTAGSSFTDNGAIALRHGTGELFAIGGGAIPGIYGFDVSGLPPLSTLSGFSPLSTSPPNDNTGLAVDETALPSAGNLYYSPGIYGPNQIVYGFDQTGTPLGGNFPINPEIDPGPPPGGSVGLSGDICGTAVDSSGHLWVANYGLGRLLEYSSSGVFLKSINTLGPQSLDACNIAFDSNDDLYAGAGSFPTWKYTAASGYTAATKFDSQRSNAIAVDPVNHHVFISHPGPPGDITEYDKDGNVMSVYGVEIPEASHAVPGSNINGLSVDPAQDRLYASDTANFSGGSGLGKIRVIGSSHTYPDLTLGDPSEVGSTTAVLSGTISAQGIPLSDCHFEYVNSYEAAGFDDLSSGGSVPCNPAAGSIPADSAAHAVSADLSGLSPNTPYIFRLVAVNANGSIATPSSEAFETSGPPIVETTGSPVRSTTTARLDARVDSAGSPATYHFEYGTQGPCDSDPCTSTPTRKLGPNEVQRIRIRASSGRFKLSFGSDTTPELPFNATALEVQSALQALPSIGGENVSVTGGPGDLDGGDPYFVTFTGDLGASDVQGITVINGAGKNALSSFHKTTVQTTQQGGNGLNETQSIAVAATGGQFVFIFGSDVSADLAFNADASSVASALEALPSIGVGNVVVSGGPGDASGSQPYVVHFVGSLANTNVNQLDATSGTMPLTGTTEFGAQTTVPGGVSSQFLLVSAQLEGLEAATTYHYRVVADNGNPTGPTFGKDMTVTTFAPEAPLSHGRFPGPAGSDRAWEMVVSPDTGGNPVGFRSAVSIADNGNRVVYTVKGGTPDSETGTLATNLFAERTSSGWQTKNIYAKREEATSSTWDPPGGPSDLSLLFAENQPNNAEGEYSLWRLSPDAAPSQLFARPGVASRTGAFASSDDGTRVLLEVRGDADPEHPVSPETLNLYDVASGVPHLVNFLPDGSVPTCGVGGIAGGATGGRFQRWLTPDGSLAFFGGMNACGGVLRLYMRNFADEDTVPISTSPVSGSECSARLIKWVPGAVFFYTTSRLVAEDRSPQDCNSNKDGDVYRYDLSDGGRVCVTCVSPGLSADVVVSNGELNRTIGVSEDGTRVYFGSPNRLLAGAPVTGGTYRVDVSSGDLAYVASSPLIGDFGNAAMTPDGSVVVFRSDAASLNSFNGQQNGGGLQYYRYDDRDRSLICLSCPADGGLPRGPVDGSGVGDPRQAVLGANLGLVSADGGIVAFATSTPLIPSDQNTASAGGDPLTGVDVYEWREGKLLLVTDGLGHWPTSTLGTGEAPAVAGVDPSGKDIFFAAPVQLTPDALDGYRRLYDARIGGGFEIPPAPKPCPLEVCQGTPKGTPEEQAPGTATFRGSGNASPPATRCPKAKVRRKNRCVSRQRKKAHKPARHKRAKHDRRASR